MGRALRLSGERRTVGFKRTQHTCDENGRVACAADVADRLVHGDPGWFDDGFFVAGAEASVPPTPPSVDLNYYTDKGRVNEDL